MSKEEVEERDNRFLRRLGELDAGDRARLRRSAGHALGEEGAALPLLYRLLPGLPEWELPSYYLVATLYPLADPQGEGDLGAALRRARDDKNGPGLDHRVQVLLDADEAQLPYRLRRAIQFLKAQRVAVDWACLLQDIKDWSKPGRRAQRKWARSYFAG